MSLRSAIATGDPAELPGRRDEDWRWTDIRGLIRTVPGPSAPLAAEDPMQRLVHKQHLTCLIPNE